MLCCIAYAPKVYQKISLKIKYKSKNQASFDWSSNSNEDRQYPAKSSGSWISYSNNVRDRWVVYFQKYTDTRIKPFDFVGFKICYFLNPELPNSKYYLTEFRHC